MEDKYVFEENFMHYLKHILKAWRYVYKGNSMLYLNFGENNVKTMSIILYFCNVFNITCVIE